MKTRSCRQSLPAAGAGTAAAVLVPLLSPAIAHADWESVPDIRMAVEADDNPRLGQRPERRDADPEAFEDRTSVRMLLDGRVRLRNTGQRGELFIQPRIRADSYNDRTDADLEREDLYVNSRAVYEWARASAGTRINLSRESILSSEIVDAEGLDPDEEFDEPPVDTDTGRLTFLDEHRERVIVTPYADFAVSPRTSLSVEARHVDVSYTGPQTSSRTNFTDTSFGAGIGRAIDARTGASARVIASRYEAEANGNETDTVGVEGGFSRELNELWSFDLSTGLQRSEITVLEDEEIVEDAVTNFTMNLGFTKETELATFRLNLMRLLNPNAVGFLVERNELRAAWQRRLSQRLTAGVGLRLMETGPLDGPGEERDFVRVDFDLEWSFTPSWSLSLGLGAVDQSFSGERLDGNSNRISIGAVYRGLSRRRN